MIKVKKTIFQPQKNEQNEISNIQDKIKNSIKTLYIKDKKKLEIINEYSNLINKIRNEYAKIAKENEALKREIKQYTKRKPYHCQQQQQPYRYV